MYKRAACVIDWSLDGPFHIPRELEQAVESRTAAKAKHLALRMLKYCTCIHVWYLIMGYGALSTPCDAFLLPEPLLKHVVPAQCCDAIPQWQPSAPARR